MSKLKVLDIPPINFYPIPKVWSSLIVFTPKDKIEYFNKPKNLEHVTNIFFNQRRKMIKKPLNILFKDIVSLQKKLNLDLNLRPQNLEPETYFKICEEYERLIS